MCDNNCENLNPSRVRCDVCRTINLARTAKHPKPDMQIYDKCTPVEKICPRAGELRLNPACFKVCTKEEYKICKSGPVYRRLPYYAHGKLMWAAKAGILVGAVYFTYTQGVWGDQQDVTECIRRWQEYVRSINTRRPPTFDQCGNVIKKERTDSILAPFYNIYKEVVTTCFSGIVKVPLILKCMYIDYLKAMEERHKQLLKERNIRRTGPKDS